MLFVLYHRSKKGPKYMIRNGFRFALTLKIEKNEEEPYKELLLRNVDEVKKLSQKKEEKAFL